MKFIYPTAFLFLLGMAFNGFAEEEEKPSLSYSFFGVGTERIFYQETSTEFANEAFKSEFNASALVQTSGGFTQISPTMGFSIITSSPLLESEEREDWAFDGFGVVQQNQMSLTQNSLDIQLSFMPFDHGQYLTGGIRYQKIAFSRFGFSGVPGNIDNLNAAIISNLDGDPTSQYKILKTVIENALISDPNATEILDSNNNVIKDDQGNNIITVAGLNAAIELNPELKKGVIFENATSLMGTVGYGLDSYFVSQDRGLRYRAGIQVGLPLHLSVLNTDNNESIAESLPSGYDVLAHVGIGYQFTQEIGVLLQYQYVQSQRDQINNGNVFLPSNVFESNSFYTQVFWAF